MKPFQIYFDILELLDHFVCFKKPDESSSLSLKVLEQFL